MTDLRLSDAETGLQVLSVFVRYRVKAAGTLRRTHFFDVRDDDFLRGLTEAVRRGWIKVHHRDRYRYVLTEDGYAEGYRMESVDK